MLGAQVYLLSWLRGLSFYSEDSGESKEGTSLIEFAFVSTSVGSKPSGRLSCEVQGAQNRSFEGVVRFFSSDLF